MTTMKERTKAAIKTATARFVRRAAGRISKRECAKLGRLYGGDLHWKYSDDTLAHRAPGDFARSWSSKTFPYKKYWKADLSRRLAYLFCWYGPKFGHWPGDRLLLAEGGWRVSCAPGCVCGKCWRPTPAITLAIVEATPALEDETPSDYFVRVTALHSLPYPPIAKTNAKPSRGALEVSL